jgi:hypothetical protein
MKSKMRLTVYFFEGNYYANIALAKGKKMNSDREVFSIERDINAGEIKNLQDEALLKARATGINHVIGIDV